jgi:uncharacterized membrane protein YvbJ
MSSLISCPHCAHQIHESAPSCPQCGAARTNVGGTAGAYTSYGQVPWYRKRWFAVISVLVFMPIFLVVAFTGDVYFEKNGELQAFPKKTKFIILGIFVFLILLQMRGG